jgi:hypothetical protein
VPTAADLVFRAGGAQAPADYAVPARAQIRLHTVQAEFVDNGAGGDWLPAVVILDQAGHVIARAVDQGVKVTAGSDAEVSWFPGVKHAAAGASVIFPTSAIWAARAAIQTIGSGAAAAISFTTFTYAQGANAVWTPPVGAFSTLTWQNFGHVVASLIVDWPAGAYDRYTELTIANPSEANYTDSPRQRGSLTPDSDHMTLTANLTGDASGPTTLTCNVFQASGSNKTITAELAVYAFPTLVA